MSTTRTVGSGFREESGKMVDFFVAAEPGRINTSVKLLTTVISNLAVVSASIANTVSTLYDISRAFTCQI